MAARKEEEKEKKKHQKRKSVDVPKPHKSFKKSIKDYPARSAAAAEPPASLLVQDKDPDFPRGDGRLLSREEEAEFDRVQLLSLRG
ncbi:hypothetical protein J5N97_010992 [Dioscorea zingiberensis]|uniref:Uncharacterized protein n=1 Tax=Dioscorea zingiberensis TaxID=325984 RepID=A0A9D5D1T3_9LILI|nr:hypothetical protein J5N97_010992 [Dioscorea zingiberensis]